MYLQLEFRTNVVCNKVAVCAIYICMPYTYIKGLAGIFTLVLVAPLVIGIFKLLYFALPILPLLLVASMAGGGATPAIVNKERSA